MDFNAHTQLKDDCLEHDDTVAEITGCDLLREASFLELQNVNPAFTCFRYNLDVSDINRNGKHLLALRQTLDFKIVNGRVGSDKYFGRSTCHKTDAASVIDYVKASECMVPYISHFNVEMFDPCFSDVRCPVKFEFSCDVTVFSQCISDKEAGDCIADSQSMSFEPEVLPKMIFKWSNESAVDFQNAVSVSQLMSDLFEQLRNVSSNVTQENIDDMCPSLSKIMIDATKTYKELKIIGDKESGNRKRKSPPWFDKKCVEKRKECYKMKII